ncbi:YadA-like family protein [Veillonella criceti]|uniref:Haemagglutinin n=1 Tax=Veillonella criceti TaxID=103891 RepID=A0A380NLP3_9FIRM|nr:YadA-like family protein [Veillonella criceti]SUP44153.1 Haemagglutinin [Veillonella criceti]
MKQKRALSVLVLAAISVSAGVVQGAETGAKFIGIGPTNPEVTTGSNIDGSGATGANALAIGVAAQAKAINGTAIGVNAQADTTNATAIGNGAKVNNEGGSAIGGIAIGTNAHSHNMSNGNHESIITFGRDRTALTGGIAIGQDTHARIGNVELGNRDYRGQIGDFDFSATDGKIGGTAIANSGKLKNSDVTTGVGSTTVGDNSFNMGNFSSINGSYNVISKAYDKPTASWVGNQLTRGMNALHNAGAAIQGFGSSISGSLNSIEGNEPLNANISSLLGVASDPVNGLMYSGTASNIVGTANRISKSNGALIFGTGNEITNSYITPNSPIIMDSLSTNVPFLGTLSLKPTVASNSIKELADTLRKYSQDNRMGSVGIMGGANKADYALFSTISGVGNTLTGAGATNNVNLNSGNTKLANVIDGNTFATFNAITGYENTGKVVSHSYINGSYNNLENATENIVIGNNQTLKGTEGSKAKGNIILGFRDKKDETALKNTLLNAVAIGNDSSIAGDNAIAIGYKASSGVENGVALGSQAVAGTGAGISGYDPVKNQASTETDKIWKSTLGAVSVGNDANTRQITNLAAGMAPTDAVNVAQLQAVSGMIVKPTISILSKGRKSDTTYVGGSAVVTNHDVNGMIFDFGDGLYAEKQKNTDGKDVILVGVDKNVIKPGVDGAPGTPGIPGKDGTVVEVSKNEETGETTITTNPDTAEKNSVVVKDGKNGKDGIDGKDGVFDFSIIADKTVTPITVAKDSPLVEVHGDSNIQTIANGNTLTVSLNKDITVNSVTTKTIQAESYKVGDATYINEQGLNANNKVIKNVAAGEDMTDAANVGQLRELNNTVSQSIHKLQKDSNRADAMGAALAALSPLQYDPLEPTQIMAGYGYYGGENAFALGLAHYKHESLLFRAGVAMNGGNSKLMANAGVTWKFGDSKKERALVEEYRQGPISSSYVLQDKLAILEAENIQIKAMHEKLVADYSQLEKDNAEMKAKIDVLMQRMGL